MKNQQKQQTGSEHRNQEVMGESSVLCQRTVGFVLGFFIFFAHLTVLKLVIINTLLGGMELNNRVTLKMIP